MRNRLNDVIDEKNTQTRLNLWVRVVLIGSIASALLLACRETAGPSDAVARKIDNGVLWWAISGTSDGGFLARQGNSSTGSVNRYTRDGALVWSEEPELTGDCPEGQPGIISVDNQDAAYVPSSFGLVALNSSGKRLWCMPQVTGGVVAIGSDNRVYAETVSTGFAAMFLYALNKTTGEIVWQVPTALFQVTTLLLDEGNRNLYTLGGPLVAYDPVTGQEKWRRSQSETSEWRAYRRARKIAERLSPEGTKDLVPADLWGGGAFPPKPKWMRWSTYASRVREYRFHAQRYQDGAVESLDRLLAAANSRRGSQPASRKL